MKELSIVKQMVADGQISQEVAEKYFPELKESEDERVRKALIKLVKKAGEGYENVIDGVSIENAIAWLEKQGEQKPDDKVEPKFKVGDKIRRKEPRSFDKDMQVARIEKDYYICNHIGKFSSEVVPFSKESSYELIEQKSAEWSEEDECYMSECIGAIATKDGWSFEEKRKTKHWLKSLKDRYSWKPSDEQMKALRVLNLTGNISYAGQGQVLIELYNDLKKLKG